MSRVVTGPDDDVWTDMIAGPVPTEDLRRWAVTPACGAVVVFCGTARDHSEGRPDVTELFYEAYDEGARAALARVATECRRRWPDLGRVGILHRTGEVPLRDDAVAVAVSAPHRADAFEAARFAIDAVKESAPIWKRERWAGGDDWGRQVAPIAAPEEVS